MVRVHYVGVAYSTGEEFDAGWNRGDPLQFQLGAGHVIAGWARACGDEGRRLAPLIVHMACGDRGAGRDRAGEPSSWSATWCRSGSHRPDSGGLGAEFGTV